LTTAEQLAEEYHVAPRTIQADGQFAEAVDTLEDQGRADIRAMILQRTDRGSAGPFYTGRRQDTCARCICAEQRDEHLTQLLRRDPATLTRRQLVFLMRQDCPSNKKICAWDHQARLKHLFRPMKRNKDGLDSYCVLCRRIYDHLRRRKPEYR